MKEYKGIESAPGIAIGVAYFMDAGTEKVEVVSSSAPKSPTEEIESFHQALETAKEQLSALITKTKAEVGEAEAAILEVQSMMLDDADFTEGVEAMINGGESASAAVKATGQMIADTFAAMDDEYFKARSADILDMSGRIYNILTGNLASTDDMPENAIVIADDITPSQTLAMDKGKIAAFVTRGGSKTSHTSILARTLGIPSIITANVPKNLTENSLQNGIVTVVEAKSGVTIFNPSDAVLQEYQEKVNKQKAEEARFDALRGLESVTKAGQKVKIFANIGNTDEAKFAIENDAEGVGLFRSEFLFLGRDNAPSEEEQFSSYKQVAELFNGKQVVIRTMDIGADKQADYLNLPKEENPALGFRATRIALADDALFQAQLRAILRASAFGKIAIMFPMIASAWEIEACKDAVITAKKSLKNESIAYDDSCELGIMIETPAAAVLADDFAKSVDFFSVGTNDLTQYTLAADRQGGPEMERFSDPHHPAVLKLLENVAKAAKDNGIWAGVCGELGSDLSLTEFFLKAGFDELSVSAKKVLPLREKVRSL